MASSSYYYSLYTQYKKEAKDLSRNISDLQKIKNSLTGDFYDEQGNVNQELNNLKDDLNKSVRHDSKFTYIAGECENYKEKSTTSDANLNNAVISLENEISSLNTKKNSAEQKRDSYYRQYVSAKEEERQKALQALKDLVKIK